MFILVFVAFTTVHTENIRFFKARAMSMAYKFHQHYTVSLDKSV